MADFYGALSSTSFRVKDEAAFLADPDVAYLKQYVEGKGFFQKEDGYFSFAYDDQYPSTVLTDWDGDTEIEHDFASAISRHIVEGDVCQLGVSGQEKLRYIGGAIVVVTSKGVAYVDGQTCWQTRLSTEQAREEATAQYNAVLGVL
jgi:hypothetical protein